MKKILLFITFLFISTYTFSAKASDITLESTQSFYLSQWIVESRPIRINISNYNDSINSNTFKLILPEDSNIRFSEDTSGIKISWSGSEKILSWVTVLPNLREIKFNLSEKLLNGNSFDISWLKLKIYNKAQWDRYIWIDLNWDNTTEAISSNWYRVLDTLTYSDLLAPSEVFNFTWTVVDNKIAISAEMPWDVDFQWIVIENLDTTWKVLSSFFKPNLDNFTYDMQSTYSSIRIKTVDIRANYSNWVVYTIDSLKPIIIETNTGTTIPVVTEDPIFQEPEVVVDVVEKYEPVFKNQSRLLNKVVKFVDDYVAKKLLLNHNNNNESSALIARNKIVIELELLDTASKEQKTNILTNIKLYFKELVWELK